MNSLINGMNTAPEVCYSAVLQSITSTTLLLELIYNFRQPETTVCFEHPDNIVYYSIKISIKTHWPCHLCKISEPN
jgi:hypothetical protein